MNFIYFANVLIQHYKYAVSRKFNLWFCYGYIICKNVFWLHTNNCRRSHD